MWHSVEPEHLGFEVWQSIGPPALECPSDQLDCLDDQPGLTAPLWHLVEPEPLGFEDWSSIPPPALQFASEQLDCLDE